MQITRNVRSLIGLWGLALVFLVPSCTQFEGTDPSQDTAVSKSNVLNGDSNARITPASTPTSAGGIVPAIIPGANEGGNRTCEEVAEAFDTDYPGEVDDPALAVDVSFTGVGGGERRNWTGSGFDGTAWPAGFTVNVTEGTFVDWSYTPPPGFCLTNVAFIVKGSSDANVYYYEADADGNILYADGGLASPINASSGSAGLSNLTICYSIEPCDTVIKDDCESDETAWASRAALQDKYNPLGGGNWATWINYTKYTTQTYRLYAGQFYDIGGVELKPEGSMVRITITLNEDSGQGFSEGGFQEGANNVKIQGYASAPTGNPSPGLFKTSKGTATGTSYSVLVKFFPYYGIHVDAIRYYMCCEIEEPV